jgi:hypothetical protein
MIFLLSCSCAPSHALGPDDFVVIDASVGLEHSDNVIYTPISGAGGEDSIQRAGVGISLNPKITDWLEATVGIDFDTNHYTVRPDFNTTGIGADLTLMWNPIGPNYIYALAGGSSYTIGNKSPYSSASLGLQYIFDVTGSGWFWTTIYMDKFGEAYTEVVYEALNSQTDTFGIKQNLTEWFYVGTERKTSRAEDDDLSYEEGTASVGIEGSIPLIFSFSLGVEAKNRHYLESSMPGVLPKREDRQAYAFISLSRELLPSVSISSFVSSTVNECNLPASQTRQGYGSYNENVVNLSLNFRI